MERGKLTIEYRPTCNDIAVELELVNDTVWITKHEIADIFNVFTSAVTGNLRVIKNNDEIFFQANTLQEEYLRNGRTFYRTLYNLDIVIELAFNIKSGYCKLIRKWIKEQVKDSLTKKASQTVIIQIDTSKGVTTLAN